MTTAEKIRELEKELAIAKEEAIAEEKARASSLHIGDTVYVIDIEDNETICVGKIDNVAKWELGNRVLWIHIIANNGWEYQYKGEDFDKYFFFEKEQAEEYLKQAKRQSRLRCSC